MQVFYPFAVTLIICLSLFGCTVYALFAEQFLWSLERDSKYKILQFLREACFLQIAIFIALLIWAIITDRTHRKFVLITDNRYQKKKH